MGACSQVCQHGIPEEAVVLAICRRRELQVPSQRLRGSPPYDRHQQLIRQRWSGLASLNLQPALPHKPFPMELLLPNAEVGLDEALQSAQALPRRQGTLLGRQAAPRLKATKARSEYSANMFQRNPRSTLLRR